MVQPSTRPHFEINLDLPPFERWKESALNYRDLMNDTAIHDWLQAALTAEERAEWLQYLRSVVPDEYVEEMLGMIHYTNYSHSSTEEQLEDYYLSLALYELNYPSLSCSGI